MYCVYEALRLIVLEIGWLEKLASERPSRRFICSRSFVWWHKEVVTDERRMGFQLA